MDVIYIPVSENFTAEDQALMKFVPQSRAERIRTFRRDSDRKASLYAALLVIMYLRSHCYIPADELRFERTPEGKPYAPGLPVHFSCSHTDGAVLAAFSTLDETGCDIELISEPPYNVSSIAFSQNECRMLDRYAETGKSMIPDNLSSPGPAGFDDSSGPAPDDNGGTSATGPDGFLTGCGTSDPGPAGSLTDGSSSSPGRSDNGSSSEPGPAGCLTCDRSSDPGRSDAPAGHRALNFYTIWTRKEAYLKYLGTGLSGDITKTDVCDPAISGRFISRRIGCHLCSVFNAACEPVRFSAIDESAVRGFFMD